MKRWMLPSVLVVTCAVPAVAEGIAVGGRVLVPGGEPLPRADVQLLPSIEDAAAAAALFRGEAPEPVARVLTDEAGRFRIEAPHAGLWSVRVEARGFAPREAAMTPLIEPVELPDLVLPPDAGFTVRVTGPDAGLVAGAFVLVRSERSPFDGVERGAWSAPLHGGTTSGDGTVRLPHGQEERITVTASVPGGGVTERRDLRGTAASLALAAGVARGLAVTTPDGAPVAGVTALVGGRSHPIGATDAAGTVTVPIATGTTEEVLLLAQDGRRATTRVAGVPPDDGKPQAVRLPAAALAAGKLIDADSRRPIPGAVVYDPGRPALAAVTDRAGGFALRGGRGARLELTAGAPGYLPPDRTIEAILADDGRPGPTVALRPAAAIEGRVSDEDGSPVARAEITLEKRQVPGMMRIEIGGTRTAPARAVTDADGRYRLSRIDPSESYTVKARAEGFAPAETAVAGLAPYETKRGADLRMNRGCTLAGTVVTADGAPIAEAAVTVEEASDPGRAGILRIARGAEGPKLTGLTDRAGRFEVEGLPPGKFDLTATRRGFAAGELEGIEIARGASGPIETGEIVLEPGATVQGVVVDGDGAPIEGAEITVSGAGASPILMVIGGGPPSDSEEPDAVTDSAGWFGLADLSAKKKYSLSVRRAGYVDGRAGPLALPRPEPVTIVLDAASAVRGTVLDDAAEPIAGARIDVTRSRTVEMGGNVMKMVMMASATADGEGRFAFEDQEPGEISLEATASGYRKGKLEGLTIPKGADLEGLELKLAGGAVLTGQVFGPDGRPVIGASVQVAGEGEDFVRRMSGAPTDGSGVYRLDGLGPGPVSIEATHGDWPRTVRDVEVQVGVNYLDLHFKGGVEVRGRVSDATGEAVPGAVVRLSPAGRAFGGPETITDAGGEYRMPGVQDGGYRLWVQAPGYAAFRGDADVHVEGQPVHGLDVQLEVGARIRGRVSGLEPERLGDVTVRAEGGSFGGFGGVGVDSSGGFRIENLEPGGYSVVATVANSGKRASGEVEIEPGATEVALDLAFEAGLTLSGRAVQADEPVRGATVYVEGRNVRHSGWNETDHDGRFEIDGLEPGDYDVRLRHWQTGLAYDEPIGLTVSRKILLDVPTARVGGRVVDATDHEPLAGATLSLVPDGPTSSGSRRSMHSATSDLEGKFELGNVGDGGFTLTASKQGYAASTRSVVVQSGRTVDDLQLALDPTEGVTLEVRLPTGTPPAEVSLAVLEASGGTLLGGTYATGENGRVRLSSVPPGRWTAVISAAGAATSRVEVQAPGPAVPVALQPVTSLRVRVPELAGATVATIRLSDGGGHPHYGLDWTGRAEREWQMQGGSASFDRLPPGDWTVSVTAPDGRSWQGTQATASGGVAELTLE